MAHKSKNSYGFSTLAEAYERLAPTGIVPPQQIEAEQSVLGAMLTHKQSVQEAIETLGVFDFDDSPFYRDTHTQLYLALVELVEKNEPCDLLTVVNLLREKDALERAGDVPYIVSLTDKIVAWANVIPHCRMILDAHIKRTIMRVGEEMKLQAAMGFDETFEILDRAESQLFKVVDRLRRGQKDLPFKEHAMQVIEHLDRIHGKSDGLTGITTGLKYLDKLTTGFQPADLAILAARPSMGKTSLGLHFLIANTVNVPVEQQIDVGFFSLEMSARQVVQRIMCTVAGVDQQNARSGKMSDTEWRQLNDAFGKLTNNRIHIDDTPSLNPLELRTRARQWVRQYDIKLLVVDYLQLMTSVRDMDSREREISSISRALKAVAKELNIPVVALSQLNRDLERRKGARPMLSDLRESGAIEQDADLVVFIYRPEFYKILQSWYGSTEGMAELIIGKQRNGPIDDVIVRFNGKTGQWADGYDYQAKLPLPDPIPDAPKW